MAAILSLPIMNMECVSVYVWFGSSVFCSFYCTNLSLVKLSILPECFILSDTHVNGVVFLVLCLHYSLL